MRAEQTRSDLPHEVRLEGFRLVAGVLVLVGLVVALVVGAFLLGRWVESRSHPGPRMAGDLGGPLAQVVAPEDLEAEEGLTHFDRVGGAALELEPGREIPAEAARSDPPVVSRDPALAPPSDLEVDAADGPYMVQVFAGRDRGSAEQLVGRLQSAGYRVRVDSERQGGDALFKVRVGGYPSDAGAREAMEALRSKGFTGAWVTRAD